MPKKKAATLIEMHDTTFCDHTTVNMWKLINSVWHRKWIVWYMNTDHKYGNKPSIVCTPISKMAASEPAVYPTDPPRQERL